MTKEIVVVCVGGKYNPALHITQIYNHLKRHHNAGFRLTVITDNPELMHSTGHPIRCIRIPDWPEIVSPRQYWWYKIAMFSPDIKWLSAQVLYMDLDTILVNDISKFWDYELDKFCICQDFNRQFKSEYTVSNSSVIRFCPSVDYAIYANFDANRQSIMRKFRGDQDYITDWFRDKSDSIAWWPREWAMSYKWEILHGGSKHGNPTIVYPTDYINPDMPWVVPDECSIAVFHGKPDPYETNFGIANKIG
tara:strand:- start:381 stop:1127 length:747 start_codon:yes stop_codon:yes gene_type:complete